MGHDERHQSNSSGAAAAIAVAVLLVAIIGVLALAGAWLFLVRTDGVQMQTVATKQRAVVELQDSEEIQVNFVLKLDREGNISVDDETIGLDELKTRLVKAKGESIDEFSLRIIADPGCPKRHIKSVVAVFDEVGDVAWHIVSPENADAPLPRLNNVPN